jgi:hypothetical protein
MKIAVGEPGMVGEIMLKVLAERNFPVTINSSSIRTFCWKRLILKVKIYCCGVANCC